MYLLDQVVVAAPRLLHPRVHEAVLIVVDHQGLYTLLEDCSVRAGEAVYQCWLQAWLAGVEQHVEIVRCDLGPGFIAGIDSDSQELLEVLAILPQRRRPHIRHARRLPGALEVVIEQDVVLLGARLLR